MSFTARWQIQSLHCCLWWVLFMLKIPRMPPNEIFRICPEQLSRSTWTVHVSELSSDIFTTSLSQWRKVILVFVFVVSFLLGHFAELIAINEGWSSDSAANFQLCALARRSSLTKRLCLPHCSMFQHGTVNLLHEQVSKLNLWAAPFLSPRGDTLVW